jgi:hypothetical protein
VEVTGCAVKTSPGWGYANHESHVNFTRNVSYDVLGAHYATEVGNEIGIYDGNVAIKAKGCSKGLRPDLLGADDARGLASDFGAEGLGYWFHTTYGITFNNNIAAGCRYSGLIFWGHHDSGNAAAPLIPTSNLPAALRTPPNDIAGPRTTMDPYLVPLYGCSNNAVFNSGGGFDYRGVMRDDTGFDIQHEDSVKHITPCVISNFKIWNVYRYGLHVTYASRLRLVDCLVRAVNPGTPLVRPDSLTPIDPDGVGMMANKNVRYLEIDNIRVEGFHEGVRICQTSGQGLADASEFPMGWTKIKGGTLLNNTWNMYPVDGRNGDLGTNGLLVEAPPISPWVEMNPFPTATPIGNPPVPLAVLPSTAATNLGGTSYRFDGSNSSDPNYNVIWDTTNQPANVVPATNDLAAYRWDFGDGTMGWGRYPVHYYATTGNKNVTLTVLTLQGRTASVTRTFNIVNAPYPNRVNDPGFDQTGAFATVAGSIEFSPNKLWRTSTTSRWTLDNTLHRARVAAAFGGEALVQVILDRFVTRGSRPISFKLWNTEGDATPNRVRVRVWGMGGKFSITTSNDDPPVNESYNETYTQDLLWDSGNVANGVNATGVTRATTANFGTGYRWLIIKVHTQNVNPGNGDALSIDDVNVGQ